MKTSQTGVNIYNFRYVRGEQTASKIGWRSNHKLVGGLLQQEKYDCEKQHV